MNGPRSEDGDSHGRQKPVRVVSGTRVTVAFAFSQIKLQEPAEEIKELVAIVVGLAEVVTALSPSSETEALRQRAVAVLARLSGAPPPG